MKDPFSIFIGDSVYLTKVQYLKLMNKTKELFFASLIEGTSKSTFKANLDKIWGNIDHSYMTDAINQLEDMVSVANINGNPVINPKSLFKEVFKIDSLDVYTATEKKFASGIEKLYNNTLKTISNDYVDTETYLAKMVEKYDSSSNTIPYYTKSGVLHSYHSVASYNSMVFNTNLTKSGWNRTLYDAELLGNDLVYLPAHPFACPMCAEHQGKVYSTSGENKKYPSQETAIKGGVGHPNCKHQWILYWGKDQIQKEKYNSTADEEKYTIKQKINALELEKSKLASDYKVYMTIGNQSKADETRAIINKINAAIRELKQQL